MPTYQYACTSCGEQLEAVQRFSDDPLTVCPACGGALRKVFSPVGIVFKGSGFYRTDSRNGSVPAKDGPTQDKTAKSNGDGGSSEKKADAKPAADSGSSTKSETKSSSKPTAAAAST